MEIRWTEPAVHDLTQICDYIEQHDGPEIARRIAISVWQRIATLTSFPQRGRTGRKQATRELVLGNLPYVAVYRIRKDVVEIDRILHGAQKWP